MFFTWKYIKIVFFYFLKFIFYNSTSQFKNIKNSNLRTKPKLVYPEIKKNNNLNNFTASPEPKGKILIILLL
jgi:hypothetical protein